MPGVRRKLDLCLVCLAALAEPVCHALGLPHPEGLTSLVMNHMATRP